MSSHWTDRESIRLVQLVEEGSTALYANRRKPRKTYPESFWVRVSNQMHNRHGYKRSPVACRKKFQSMKEEIQPMLPTKSKEPLVYRKPEPQHVGKALPSSPDMFFLEDLFSRGVNYGPATITIEVVGKTTEGRQLAKLHHQCNEHSLRTSKGVSNGNN